MFSNTLGLFEADDGSQNQCFYLLYNPCFTDFSFAHMHNTSCFCTLYKFLVSFQYHWEPRQLPDPIGQRDLLAFQEIASAVLRPMSPPDRLSCRWIVIPFVILHHEYPNSFSAHLRASLSTSLSHVSRYRCTPT